MILCRQCVMKTSSSDTSQSSVADAVPEPLAHDVVGQWLRRLRIVPEIDGHRGFDGESRRLAKVAEFAIGAPHRRSTVAATGVGSLSGVGAGGSAAPGGAHASSLSAVAFTSCSDPKLARPHRTP